MTKKDLPTSYMNFLRNSSKIPCPVNDCKDQFPPKITDERIRTHLQDHHSDYLDGKDISEVISEFRNRGKGAPPPEKAGSSTQQDKQQKDSSAYTQTLSKQPADVSEELNSPDSPPKRSRAKNSSPVHDSAFSRPRTTGKLYDPNATQSSSPRPKAPPPRGMTQRPVDDVMDDEEEPIRLIRQPETRPISQEQLVAEVKGIYAGLVMVESKCIEVDNAQSSQNDAKLNNEQWQALIALHRTLLHEHHDFFLASQHPSASAALRRLASKYAMPARMWRHGIHSFLELLRHRLPASLEHMLTFIYLAYSMMALLYETVPAFGDTWIECLGDLGRYRMAIEDDDIRDREVWTAVSRHWYAKASDKAPTTGRLYHHLAILARPNALQQLFYYTKSLCVPIPFGSARESIMTLFDPILNSGSSQTSLLSRIDAAFVKAHGISFSDKSVDQFIPTVREFLDNLDNDIAERPRRWLESGYYVAIANCCALLSYGKETGIMQKTIRPRPDEATDNNAGDEQKDRKAFDRTLDFVGETHEVMLHRLGDPHVLPYLHVVLTFMNYLASHPAAMSLLDRTFPWKLVSVFLNKLLLAYREYDRIHHHDFPRPEKGLPRPLPEDFALKGLPWVDNCYHPVDWFTNDKIDDDEKYFEVASMTDERRERILWLGCQIASHGKWLSYDVSRHNFGVLPRFEKDIEITEYEPSMMSDSTSRSDSRTFTTTMGDKTPTLLSEREDEEMLDVESAPAYQR